MLESAILQSENSLIEKSRVTAQLINKHSTIRRVIEVSPQEVGT